MHKGVSLGAIMGALKVPLQETPQMVKAQIPQHINLPATKPKDGMIEPKLKSIQNEDDVEIEILKMATEGPCLDNEFGDFLEQLKVSLNFNHFSYKKAVNNNINFLRVVLVTRQMFKEKRIVVNINDSGVDRMRKVELAGRLKEIDERHAREKAERETNEMKYADKIKMFEQRSNELKKLSGKLPVELFGLLNLQVVTLQENLLSGDVPEGFSSLSGLQFLNLSSNEFTGEIPAEYGFLHSLQVLSLSNNHISGLIPVELGNSSTLEVLELRGNSLTGNIPDDISDLTHLRDLDLGRNRLTGIPDSLSRLLNLTELNLSSNNLTGDIPADLLLILSLKYLNLSSSNLEGEIPWRLASMFNDPSVFENNRKLCGKPLHNECKNERRKKIKRLILLILVIAAGAAILAFCCCGYIIGLVRWRKKLRAGLTGEKKKSPTRGSSGTEGDRGSGHNGGPKLTMFNAKITYAEALEATRHFDEENVLSRGQYGLVYKATFLDGMVLAIRRIPDTSVNEGTFRKEAEFLVKVKHRNLTVLRGYYIGAPNTRLLVYDYMPNGNLSTLLQEASHQDGHVLNWPMRHLIALGIARGLAFLHSTSMVHGDIKPQNVLFDADFEAHLCDYGLEKLALAPNAEASSSSTPIGTLGYVSPEATLSGQSSKEADVYSFGIVLLEILTGRKAVMFTEDEDIVKWVKKQLQRGQISELLEPGLLELDPESSEWEEFMLGLKVGLLCTTTDPLERPSVTDVVFMLEGCRIGPDIPSPADPTSTSPL
ncbi:putative LRR receptor-like serine/threonine-protein kinase At4g36180 [Apium graveolens]|uniref:putative LRR receptor-like serine/threonine-protein kinase At4g36180 n=1 Tax=Apium graveolens TaxID=4045 RepID=UPI003D7B36A8